METRALGRSGVTVSVLGLGTWPMGGRWWGSTDDAESIRTIHRALDLGVALFDTAEAYAAGHAEDVLGRALVGRREQAVIADKVARITLRPIRSRKPSRPPAAACKRTTSTSISSTGQTSICPLGRDRVAGTASHRRAHPGHRGLELHRG